jgi:hypothetical protein
MLASRRLRDFLVFAALSLGGCTSIGVERVAVDRDAYAERLRESEKAQLLSNIVGLRYGDAPQILRVSSVINQYTRETAGSLNLRISPFSDEDAGSVGANVLLRETPTITYTPVAGEAFAHSMLAPIPPASLLAMMAAGWAADDLLLLTTRSLNGVRSRSRAPLFEQPGSPNLNEVFAALRRLQRSGAFSVTVTQHGEGHFSARARVAPNLSGDDRADLAFLRDALNATFEAGETEIVFSDIPESRRQLAITTRTMLEILAELAQGVDIAGNGEIEPHTLIDVHSGATPPAHPYVSVRLRGRWFWIDQADNVSVRRFLLTQLLLSLTDQGSGTQAPLVTIPIN